MQPENQNPSSTPQNNQPPLQGKPKVIQPSEELLQELKSNPIPNPNVPAPPPQAIQNVSPEAQPEQSTTPNVAPPAASSIYPEATSGFGISSPQVAAPTEEKSTVSTKSDSKSNIIMILIIVLGLYIAGSAVIGLIGGLKLLSFGVAQGAGGLLTVIDIAYILIGIGLILRKEIARVIYVVVAVIGLALSTLGLYRYIHAESTVSHTNSRQSIIASTNQTIANYQSNTSIPANQKSQIIQELKNTENTQLKEAGKYSVKNTIAPVIEGYAIALIPLVFLTRPSVKEEFK